MIHMRKIVLSIIISISLISTTACGIQSGHVNAEDRYISIQLLGINDFHGQLDVHRTVKGQQVGGAEYLASYLKKYELENENTLLVHVGDAVGASSPVSALHQDEPTIEFLNTMGFDVGTVGNHEFDEGVDELKRLLFGGESEKTGYFKGADFPYTAANVVDHETGETIHPPYIVKEVGGVPLGFIGVVTTDTTRYVLPEGINHLEFTDEVVAINKAAKELKEKGVRSIIVLAHNPVSSKKNGSHPSGEIVDFAQSVDDEIDIIYGAHNHKYANTTIDHKLIVQAYSSGTAFSDVDILIDPITKDIVEKKAKIVRTYHKGMEPDKEVKDMVDSYRMSIAPLINRVIGKSSDEITRKQEKSGESQLGHFIADTQHRAMETDFVFVNSGGIRAGLDKGDITWGELYTALPFGYHLVTMNMTGGQIKEALEQQWMGSEVRMLQISGLSYTWDEKASIGERIIEIKDDQGNPLASNQTYSLTVNELLAAGGDGFSIFKEGTNQMKGPTELDIVTQYIQSTKGAINAPILDRIDLR